MSFILDALKKSEQERPKGAIPDLHTSHEPPAQPRKRRRLWPWLLLLALAVNAGVLLWAIPRESSVATNTPPRRGDTLPRETSRVSTPAAPSPPPVRKVEPATEIPSPPVASQTALLDESVPKDQLSPPAAASERGGSTPSAALKESREDSPPPKIAERIPERMDLPADTRRELPEIDISLHFYTAAPSARLVRINGRNLREGQNVTGDLLLERITPSGVVLNFRGQRFRAGEF